MKFRSAHILFFLLFLSVLSAKAQLQAGIYLNPNTAGPFCGTPTIINFLDSSKNATSCIVDYGNSVVSPNCSGMGTTYSTPGTYTVTQIVSDGVSTDTARITITVHRNPVANFSVVDNTVCAFDPVKFINTSTLGDAPLNNCAWSFGQGPNINLCGDPTTVYTTPGYFNVNLVVIDTFGCQGFVVKNKVVYIDSIPNASFTATPPVSCTSPATINFTNTSTGSATLGSVWTAGDTCTGSTDVPTISSNFSHNYKCEGCFRATLQVNNTNGCKDTANRQVCIRKVKADFTPSSLTPCTFSNVTFTNTSSNLAATFKWELFSLPGNALIASSNQVDWNYVFASAGQRKIKLTMSFGGCVDSLSKTLTVSDSIPLSFTFTTNTISCNAPLTVGVSGSNVPPSFTTGWTAVGGTIANPSAQSTNITYNSKGIYNVTYTATNSAGCISRATKVASVQVTGIKIKATVDSVQGCAPVTATFKIDSPTSNITGILWNYNPPSTSATSGGNQTSYTYSNSGSYNPWVRIQQSNGCFDTFFFPTIAIGKPSTANFSAVPLVVCKSLQPVKFSNLSKDGNGNNIDTNAVPAPVFTWSFNGTIVNGYAPGFVFDEPGLKTIALTVNNNGCSSTKTIPNYVQILGPKAEFNYSLSCSNPQLVTFTNTSSNDADQFIWDFGDNSPANTTKSPTHLYSSIQTWSVLLIAKSSQTGCVDSMRQQILLTPSASDFSASVTSGCAPLAVKFTNLTPGISTARWVFGDTASGAQNVSTQLSPTHTYNKPGVYTVKLVNNPGSLCPDSITKVQYIKVAELSANFTSTDSGRFCNPKCIQLNDASKVTGTTIQKYIWDFGDNTIDSSNTKNPVHCFSASKTYNISLKIIDTSGTCQSTKKYFSFLSGFKPAVRLSIDTAICVGEIFNYDVLDIQTGQTYQWSFGDGGSSSSRIGTYNYPAVKTDYQVRLIVNFAALGCKDTLYQTVKVDKPFVDFYAQGISANCPPLVDSFYNISSRLDLKWHWDYGDGDTSSGTNGFHVYQKPGTYTVTLIGEGINGCIGTMIKEEYVKVGGPKSKVVIEPPYGCNPLVTLTKGIIYEAKSGFYDHDDGSSITQLPIVNGDTLQVSILHTYTTKGSYVPKITITDSLGCQVTYELSDSFYVDDYPTYTLPTDTAYCAINGPVAFDVTAYNGVKYQWTPTDFLNCDTCAVILTAATDTITYTVNVTSPYGCTTTKSIILNVEAQPSLDAGPDFNLCREETRLLSAGDVYNAVWTAIENTSDDYLDNPNIIRPTVTAFSDQTWSVYSENRLGCGLYDTVRMTVIDSVEISTSPDTAICFGDKAYLELTKVVASINDTDYIWTPVQFVSYPDKNDRTKVEVSPTATTQFVITAASPKCKIDTEYINVVVNPLPDIILEKDTVVAIGTPIELVTISAAAVKYEWFAVDPLSCYDCVSSVIDAVQDQRVVVYVTNQYGCRAADSVTIRIVPCDPKFVFVPNTFTPNDDGLNDKLFVRGKALSELTTFIVSDRWGKLYYNSNNINEGWDGTVNGQQAQTNVYVWYVRAKCSNGAIVEKSGTTALVR
jgi:gliding motility-associated-like protein